MAPHILRIGNLFHIGQALEIKNYTQQWPLNLINRIINDL